MERRDDALKLSSLEGMKVSSPVPSGTVRYVRLLPASPRSAHPSMKTRATLASFVHRSIRKLAIAWIIAAALWTFSSAGRACSQYKRDRAAQQASVVALLARDSMRPCHSVRSERRSLHRVRYACS